MKKKDKEKETVYGIMEEIFNDPLKWAVLISLTGTISIFPDCGKTLEEIRDSVMKLGAPEYPDTAPILVRSELKELIQMNLVGNRGKGTETEKEEVKFYLKSHGIAVRAVRLINEIVETLTSAKKRTEGIKDKQ